MSCGKMTDCPWVQNKDIGYIVTQVNALLLKYCHDYCSADSGERGCDENCSICGSETACYCCLPTSPQSETEINFKEQVEKILQGRSEDYTAYMKEIHGVIDE
jgi:hypothetical protein